MYTHAQLYKRRGEVQAQVEAGTYTFDFLPETAHIRQVRSRSMDETTLHSWSQIFTTHTRIYIHTHTHPAQGDWRVHPIPPVMLDRRVDVGDVSPDDAKSLVEALNCGAQVRAHTPQG